MKIEGHSFLKKQVSQAVITLGGKGTRIKTITKNIPKPLYPINGKSTLERTVHDLSTQGISKFIFLVNYMSHIFESESNLLMQKYKIQIKLFIEDYPRGEAGSLFSCIDDLEDNFLFINGDIVFEMDLIKLINFHNQKQADITLVTHLTNHPHDSDCIIESPTLSIHQYKLKNTQNESKSFYLGNAGVSLLTKKVILYFKKELKLINNEVSLFKDIVINAINFSFKIYSYNTSEYLKDMGTPDRLKNVKIDISQNLISKRSYKSKQKVLFLDRDNTLIKCPDKSYITTKEDIFIFEDRIKKIAKISEKFDFCLIITNQPQISMGLVSWQDVIEINGIIINECQLLDLKIAGTYLCPHHPHSGFANEINSLKLSCFCRKPLPGLFYEAAYMRNIDLKSSLLIGDSLRDSESAKNIGMEFLQVDNL